jgi:hypothetical protein
VNLWNANPAQWATVGLEGMGDTIRVKRQLVW